MSEQLIRVACKGASTVDYKDLVPFQGGLKDLHEAEYQKLRKQIIETGFSAPFIVWKNEEKLYLMDGHQRLRVVQTMVEKEGWMCPRLPMDFVEAATIQEAYRKCLSLASTYGKTSDQGLYEFMSSAGLGASDMDAFNFQDINSDRFADEFFNEPPQEEASEDQGNMGEVDPKPEGPSVTCPSCGHVFPG